MSEEAVTPPEADKYQELEEGDFNKATEFFIKKEDGAYEKVTKTGDHTYEKGKYFKEKEPQEQQSSTGAGPAASEVTEGPATPAVTGGVPSKEQIDTATSLATTIVRDPEFIAAATSVAAGPSQTAGPVQPETAAHGGRRRTKRKQQKKGKSAKKGGKKHRKTSGKKSRRSSSKKSRRHGRK